MAKKTDREVFLARHAEIAVVLAHCLDNLDFLRNVAPRRLNKSIPADLETIILKMIEKNPTDRYASAGELADDLGRFVRDSPSKRGDLLSFNQRASGVFGTSRWWQ